MTEFWMLVTDFMNFVTNIVASKVDQQIMKSRTSLPAIQLWRDYYSESLTENRFIDITNCITKSVSRYLWRSAVGHTVWVIPYDSYDTFVHRRSASMSRIFTKLILIAWIIKSFSAQQNGNSTFRWNFSVLLYAEILSISVVICISMNVVYLIIFNE